MGVTKSLTVFSAAGCSVLCILITACVAGVAALGRTTPGPQKDQTAALSLVGPGAVYTVNPLNKIVPGISTSTLTSLTPLNDIAIQLINSLGKLIYAVIAAIEAILVAAAKKDLSGLYNAVVNFTTTADSITDTARTAVLNSAKGGKILGAPSLTTSNSLSKLIDYIDGPTLVFLRNLNRATEQGLFEIISAFKTYNTNLVILIYAVGNAVLRACANIVSIIIGDAVNSADFFILQILFTPNIGVNVVPLLLLTVANTTILILNAIQTAFTILVIEVVNGFIIVILEINIK